jgi:4'-phosphopantetheinyl transferase
VPTAPPTLPSNECHVWWLVSSAVPAGLEAVLDVRERHRHGRLRRPADQLRYLAAHVLARLALALYLDRDPAQLPFGLRCRGCGSTDHGKPMLLPPEEDLEFSLSHSGGRVVVAVARRASVGIDVEAIAPDRDYSDVAARVLSPPETDELLALPGGDRSFAFVRYWCRKEAVLKASGFGLSLPLSDLTVTGPKEPARVLDWAGGPHGSASLCLHDLDPGPGYAACVALVDWGGDRVVERDGETLLRLTGRSACRT